MSEHQAPPTIPLETQDKSEQELDLDHLKKLVEHVNKALPKAGWRITQTQPMRGVSPGYITFAEPNEEYAYNPGPEDCPHIHVIVCYTIHTQAPPRIVASISLAHANRPHLTRVNTNPTLDQPWECPNPHEMRDRRRQHHQEMRGLHRIIRQDISRLARRYATSITDAIPSLEAPQPNEQEPS